LASPVIAAVAATLALAASAAPPGSPAACRTVHGRMSLWNGAPTVRLAVIGTHRVLGVRLPGDSFEHLPAAVTRLWDGLGDEARWKSAITGDFLVCAQTPSRPGRMQMVEVTDAARLRLSPGR
jgi:hypothetical protein